MPQASELQTRSKGKRHERSEFQRRDAPHRAARRGGRGAVAGDERERRGCVWVAASGRRLPTYAQGRPTM